MKHLITIAFILISSLGFSQATVTHEDKQLSHTKITDLGISITIDSAEELNAIFTSESVTDLAEMASDNEKISFELICNKKVGKDAIKTHRSYKVEGRTDNLDHFMSLVDKIKIQALNYYKN